MKQIKIFEDTIFADRCRGWIDKKDSDIETVFPKVVNGDIIEEDILNLDEIKDSAANNLDEGSDDDNSSYDSR